MKIFILYLNSKNISLLILIFIFLFGMWNMHRPILEGSHNYMHGDLGDARLVNIQLEHTYQYLFGDKDLSFWSPSWSFFPYPKTFSFSDTMLGSMPIYSVFREIGFKVQESYQLWLLFVSALNFWLFYLFLRKNRLAKMASCAGAFLFSFSLPVSSFLFHMQLMPRFFIPLSLYLLTCSLQSVEIQKRQWYLIGFYTTAAIQIWASAYIGWFYYFTLICCLFLFFLMPIGRKSFIKIFQDRWGHIIGLILSLLIFTPLFLNYTKFTDLREYSEVLLSLPTLKSYVISHSGSYFYNSESFYSFEFLNQFRLGGSGLFSGFIVSFLILLSALYALKTILPNYKHKDHQRKKTTFFQCKTLFWVSFIGSWMIFFITLNVSGMSLWQFIYDLFPGAQKIRALNRIVLLLLLYHGILIAVILSQWEKKNISGKIIVFFLLIGIAIENYSIPKNNYSKKEHYQRVSKLIHMIQENKHCKVFYYSKKGEVQVIFHVDAMWASLETGVSTINGYSAKAPSDWPFWTNAKKTELHLWLKKYNWSGKESSICTFQR